MKRALVLLVLLCIQIAEVHSQPYTPENEACRDKTKEYLNEVLNLCCRKCPPGHRQKRECNRENDSLCEECEPGSYLEKWNYASNCLRCTKCKAKNALVYAKNCTSASNSKCICQPGKFCQMNDRNCAACAPYTQCEAGFGVSVAGTPTSNVKCEKCPNGTFSSHASYADHCMPHKNCDERFIITKGDAISDTVCANQTAPTWPPTESVPTSMRSRKIIIGTSSHSTEPHVMSVSILPFNMTSHITTATPDSESTQVIVWVIGVLLPFFLMLLMLFLYFYKRKGRRASSKIPSKTNGNLKQLSETGHLKTSWVSSPEHACLLQNGKTASNPSQCCNISESKTDVYSSRETVRPSQPILTDDEISALTDPMTLLSNTELLTPPPSIPTQSSLQPTSAQIISPVTNSPHVNVKITLHIGNGSCGSPSYITTNLSPKEQGLPFGEEEESISIPQQEAGKQMLTSVQEENACFNT